MYRKIKNIMKLIDRRLFFGKLKLIYSRFFLRQSTREHMENYFQSEEYFIDPTLKKQLKLVDPKGVICSGRLDVIVRYLLFKDIVYGRENKENLSLYCRTILARTGGHENKGFYSQNTKEGMDQHIKAAQELCESMKNKGFKQEYYIPVATDYGLYNGAHRLAAAMALDQDVWIKYCGEHGIKDMGFSWFCENGFSDEDKIKILRGFSDIHHNCGIFILYGSCQKQWAYIEKQIRKKMQIVGAVDINFSHDYITFENLIHDIYHDYSQNSRITDKIALLKFSDLIIRVILVSDELSPNDDLYKSIRNCKAEIRERLHYDYSKEAYVTLHSSDTYEEFEDLKRTVLSVNNLTHLGMRIHSFIRPKFLEWINEFKEYAYKHNIPIEDTCIVGSSPLEVVGIRNSTDIDIVIAPELRKFGGGDGITHLTPDLDIVTRNYIRNNDGVYITDEQLIYDENYHFMFMGCKFANIEYILFRKSSSEREKDIKDVRLINIYFEYYKFFNNKKVLQEQINRELVRRRLK